MQDPTFLFSLIAIILSLASVILVIIRIGIGLGLEFVEKKEIREMRTKIDDTLKNEWIDKVKSFLVARPDYAKTKGKGIVDEEKITKEIVELGEATRYNQIASTLLKVLSRIISDIVKAVILDRPIEVLKMPNFGADYSWRVS